jgi:molybdenum cofactor biosynthesis protein B
LVDALTENGYILADRVLIPDDIYLMRAVVSRWIADPEVQAVVVTGGTGFTERDSTPEAIAPLLEKEIKGFGEVFRSLSHTEIGSSTIQSRAIGGMTNNTVIFCLPGSTGACRTGWEGIVRDQLDSRHRPCNFVGTLMKKADKNIASIKPFCETRS